MKENVVLCEENRELVEKSVHFATNLARQFHRERMNIGIEQEEYVGAALLGLCDAGRRYDPSKGQNFRTFSYMRIRGSMYDLLRRGGGISRSCFKDIIDPERLEEDENATERIPYSMARDAQELIQLASVLQEYGIKIFWDGQQTEICYAEAQDPEQDALYNSTHRYLRELIESLPEREQKVIERRYFHDETFEEMTKTFGCVTKSWLSRVHVRALEQLKSKMVADARGCARAVHDAETHTW